MRESCLNCRNRFALERLDYSKGGCEHTSMEGYVCMAFADEGVANWMVGLKQTEAACECWTHMEERKRRT